MNYYKKSYSIVTITAIQRDESSGVPQSGSGGHSGLSDILEKMKQMSTGDAMELLDNKEKFNEIFKDAQKDIFDDLKKILQSGKQAGQQQQQH